METKKNPKQDLENYRMLFVQIGLVLALVATIIVMEWRTYKDVIADLGELKVEMDNEVIPITHYAVATPPPPPSSTTLVPDDKIIENNKKEETIEEKGEEKTLNTGENKVKEIKGIEDEPEVSDEVLNFMVVENKPVFPGCENKGSEAEKFQCLQMEMQNFIARNFKFPAIAKQMGIQGKVYINFEITQDGSVRNIEVVRGVDKSLDDEAVRVINKLPKFTPAKQRGRPVRVQYTVPINASLQ